MDKTTSFILFFIFNAQACSCEDKINKHEIISKIMQHMKTISENAIKSYQLTDANTILEQIRPLVIESAASYANSKAYVDIIMKGFQLMIIDKQNLDMLRNNMKKKSIKASTSDSFNNNEIIGLKSKHIQIEGIIDTIKEFARNHAISLEDALAIIKLKMNSDTENKFCRSSLLRNTTQQYIKAQYTDNLSWNYNSSAEVYETTTSSIFLGKSEPISFKTLDELSLTSDIDAVTDSYETQPCFLNSCVCKENISIPINDKCIDFCHKICSQKFNLQQWICKSLNGSDSIHINFTCDGLIDCEDESDENECNYNSDNNLQFKSNVIFKDLLQPLANPDKEKEFIHFRSKLRALYNRVKYLVKNSKYKSSKGDIEILELRNNIIEEILLMYNEFAKKINDDVKIDEIYNFFANIKVEILRALKLSVSGNVRSIPEGQCLCRENVCAVPRCPDDCQRICSSFYLFDRYHCKRLDLKAAFISMKQLCDGKYDCSNLDDEINCQKEPCRSHHLVMLKRKFLEWNHKAIEENKGSRFQHVFEFWINKVLDKLTNEETKLKQKQTSFNTIITETLMDLVLEYKKYEKHFDKFNELAQIIINAKRSCGI